MIRLIYIKLNVIIQSPEKYAIQVIVRQTGVTSEENFLSDPDPDLYRHIDIKPCDCSERTRFFKNGDQYLAGI